MNEYFMIEVHVISKDKENQGTGICIAINSFSEFLADDKETKAMIMEDFEEDILPFWETEVASVVKNGTPRSFIVLTID